MAETITWRSMAGPNFSGASQALDAAGNRFNQGMESISKLGTDMRAANIAAFDKRKLENTTKALASIANTKDPAELDAQAGNFSYEALKTKFGDEIDIPSVIDGFNAQKGNILKQNTANIQYKNLVQADKDRSIIDPATEEVTQLLADKNFTGARTYIDQLAEGTPDTNVSSLYNLLSAAQKDNATEERAVEDQNIQRTSAEQNTTIYNQNQEKYKQEKGFEEQLSQQFLSSTLTDDNPEQAANKLLSIAKTPQQVDMATKFAERVNTLTSRMTKEQQSNVAITDNVLGTQEGIFKQKVQSDLKRTMEENPVLKKLAVFNSGKDLQGLNEEGVIGKVVAEKAPREGNVLHSTYEWGDSAKNAIRASVNSAKSELAEALKVEPSTLEIPAQVLNAALMSEDMSGGFNDSDKNKLLLKNKIVEMYKTYKEESEKAPAIIKQQEQEAVQKLSAVNTATSRVKSNQQKLIEIQNKLEGLQSIYDPTTATYKNAEGRLMSKLSAAEAALKKSTVDLQSTYKNAGADVPENLKKFLDGIRVHSPKTDIRDVQND